MADKKKNAVIYGNIVVKCWEDEAYRKRFLEDPEEVLAEAGFVLDEGVTYKVIEAPKFVEYLVLPHTNTKEAVQEMAKRFLNKAEKNDALLPRESEVRIVQNTEDLHYLILPVSPKSLTKAELKMVAGGDEMTTEVEEAVVQTYDVASTTVEAVEIGTTAVVDCEVVVVGVVI
ncbi:MAG: NHLP leader peptide family RiPP precursor [Schwartzia sp.]|nr:NHLP leader peptide family RiPP precursor [Schwartzia sp. (in: firmicutes)]